MAVFVDDEKVWSPAALDPGDGQGRTRLGAVVRAPLVLVKALVEGCLWGSLAVVALAWFGASVSEIPFGLDSALLLFSSSVIIYNVDRCFDAVTERREPTLLWKPRGVLILASMVLWIVVLWRAPVSVSWLVLAGGSVCLFYGIPIGWRGSCGRRARLKDVPGLKSAMVPGAVTVATLGVPLGYHGDVEAMPLMGVAGFILWMTLANVLLLDVRDVDHDRRVGNRTLPSQWGSRKTERLVIVGSLGAALFFGIGWRLEWVSDPAASILPLLVAAVLATRFPLVRRLRLEAPRWQCAFCVDGLLFLPLILTWI